MNPLGSTVGIGYHRLSVDPHEVAPFLEDTPVNKDPLDVTWLCVEDHLAHLVNAWSKVGGIWIEHNDVSLLTRSQIANLGLHIEDLGPTDGGQLQRSSNCWVDIGVARQRTLQSDGGAHGVEHITGIIGTAIQAETNANAPGMDRTKPHDPGGQAHVGQGTVS